MSANFGKILQFKMFGLIMGFPHFALTIAHSYTDHLDGSLFLNCFKLMFKGQQKLCDDVILCDTSGSSLTHSEKTSS